MSSPPAPDVDRLASGLLRGLAAEFLSTRHHDVLSPLRFLAAGEAPHGEPPAVDRRAIAGALAVANAAYGHPRADELARRLADPSTRVIVTGQQTGLFGGPLLGYVKAAAAVRWAESLTARGEPAVALFWMATEDHDWDEVASATVLGPDGPFELALGADPQPLAPIGLRTVGGAVEPLLEELAGRYPRPWSADDHRRLARWWRPEARFGEAFARQMAALFGGRSPLVVDALLPELKRAEAPLLARLVERRRELAEALAAREREIRARGFHLQVAAQPGASPLFVLRGGERRRIEWRPHERWALRGVEGARSVDELFAALADNPAVVSPGALARPAIQDAVFGTFLQVMGPGELAYLGQAAVAYEILDLAPPWTSLRPSALLLGRRDRERLAALDVDLGALLADPEAVERELGARVGGDFVAPAMATITAHLATLEAPALALDPALARPHAKTARTVGRALERFARKAATAAARRDATTRDRFARLVAAIRPGGVPQERALSAVHFLLRYGDGFATALLDGLDLDPRHLSLVDPEPAEVAR